MTEKQVKKLEKRLERMEKFIRKNAFLESYQPAQDCSLSVCRVCEKAAWLIGDIKHKRNCQVGNALKRRH